MYGVVLSTPRLLTIAD
uniref:Uncharacterized protein n=1 Tax=Moniliophthora roreri TaxID=221103 RepID=A0A0W0FYF1_MONRR